jgi:mono/diheme cytochrome c family protein
MCLKPKISCCRLACLKEYLTLGILRKVLLLLMICLLGGCLENVSLTSPEDFIPDNDRLRQGRKLFQTICIKCHPPRNIRQYSDKEWKKIIGKKLKKDPLMMTSRQAKGIIEYPTHLLP